MNAHTAISATITTARNDAAARAVANYADIRRDVLALPDKLLLDLFRDASNRWSGSAGHDHLYDGFEAIAEDICTDTLRNDEPVLFSAGGVA